MKNIFIVAAENSAENYGVQVIDEFKKHSPETKFFGVGGDKFLQKGVDVLIHNRELAVIGIIEIISHIVKLKRYLNFLFKTALERKVDAVLLIDFPDFNLRIAKKFRKRGIPVYYYVSPTVWAWRYSRVKLLKRNVTHTFIIFPFEIEIFKKENIPFTYTGHPFISMVKVSRGKEEIKKILGVNGSDLMITLLPGSRKSEVNTLLSEMIKAMEILKEIEDIKVFVLKANSIKKSLILDYLKNTSLNIQVIDQESEYDLINASDVVLTACGASNLEMAILGVPFVAVYKVKMLSYVLGKRLVKIDNYSIVNILAQKKVVPELIQKNCNADEMVKEIQEIIKNKNYRDEILSQFEKTKKMLSTDTNPSEIIHKKITRDFFSDKDNT